MSSEIVFVVVLAASLGMYALGIHTERKAWNKLIEDGRLPRPRRAV